MSKLFEFTKAKVKKKSRANFWKQRASLSKGATIKKRIVMEFNQEPKHSLQNSRLAVVPVVYV